ncbi:hypothetical protein PUR28_17795 [Streptomyces sp. BE308]|uniref:hypothetical protein n=1 Tax=Streptomyces sp. BE308 TaxID=3002529 RepID=UPI002E7828AD|nr:hypothetical protein [Streptomyces sp. BE308]MEE1792600.1 hypothetical protein [Streptomyces sp. BE308]
MRSISSPPAHGPEPAGQPLTTAEVYVVIVVVVAAAGLAALGMPVTGALTFTVGVLGVAVHAVRALRGPQALLPNVV